MSPGHVRSTNPGWAETGLLALLCLCLIAACTAGEPQPFPPQTSQVPRIAKSGGPEFCSGCPCEFPADMPDGKPFDICTWNTLSPYGEYAVQQPVETEEYGSCTEWREALAQWNENRNSEDLPGMTGYTLPQFEIAYEVLNDTSTSGPWMVALLWTPNPAISSIRTARPNWPMMSSTWKQITDQVMAFIVEHEKGHQNLAGSVRAAYREVHEIPRDEAATARDAGLLAGEKFKTGFANAADNSVDKVIEAYERIVQHGVRQVNLGGNNTEFPECYPVDLKSTQITSSSGTEAHCQTRPPTRYIYQSKRESRSADTKFLPLPASYEETHSGSTFSPGCDAPPDHAEQIAAIPAVSGEDRTLDTSTGGEFTVDDGNELWHELQQARSSASMTYVQEINEDGRKSSKLTVRGSVTCRVEYSDTHPQRSRTPGSRAGINLKVYVPDGGEARITLDGTWPLTDVNERGVYLSTSPPLPDLEHRFREYYGRDSLGTVQRRALAAGTYEFSLQKTCAVPRDSTNITTDGAINYVVVFES